MAFVRKANHRKQRITTKRHCNIRKIIAPKKSSQFRYRRSRQANFVITDEGYVVRLILV